jgi:predicted lipase
LWAKYLPSALVQLFTFGSPRVGNAAFAAAFDQLIGNGVLAQSYRVTHQADIVPHLPLAIMGFQHVSRSLSTHPDLR